MSKLYLVHLRPLGLHGIFLVVLCIQVAVVSSCHGTTRDILRTSSYLTPPVSPRSKLSQVTMGQPGTSWDIPLPYTTLPVPGLSCPKLPWDNPGHPGNLPLPYTTLPVPGPSCLKLPWDNPGHPGNLSLSYTTLPVQVQKKQQLRHER